MAATMCVTDSVASNPAVDMIVGDSPIYCSCQSDYCDCGSDLGITEAAALKVYRHLGFRQGREQMKSDGYRECALHIWGTHNLSTEDVLSWLTDYHPARIEWINDASCNVVFADANTVLRIIVDFAEPFDRRIALAAAAALASLVEENEGRSTEPFGSNQTSSSPDDAKLGALSHLATDPIEQFSQYFPPTGRWYKALSVPSGTISLFLRFAHTSDVKLPGSERRSLYYRRYGNPNYAGMPGILTRSFRRRNQLGRQNSSDETTTNGNPVSRALPNGFAEALAKAYDDPDAISAPFTKKSGKANHSNEPVDNPPPGRELIVYDNLYDDDEPVPSSNKHTTSVRAGSRREGIGLPIPKSPRQPRKWPRKDHGPPPDRWLLPDDEDDDDLAFSPPLLDNINVIDLREPWSTLPTNQPYAFQGTRERRILRRNVDGTTTITLIPEANNSEDRTLSMVADREERLINKRSLANRLGSTRIGGGPRFTKNRQRSRNVWDRLG